MRSYFIILISILTTYQVSYSSVKVVLRCLTAHKLSVVSSFLYLSREYIRTNFRISILRFYKRFIIGHRRNCYFGSRYFLNVQNTHRFQSTTPHSNAGHHGGGGSRTCDEDERGQRGTCASSFDNRI